MQRSVTHILDLKDRTTDFQPLLVLVILLVGLAEIYLALSWDQHLKNGRWNITINWTLQELPDSESPTLSMPMVLQIPQNISAPVTNSARSKEKIQKYRERSEVMLKKIIENALTMKTMNMARHVNIEHRQKIPLVVDS